MAWRLPIGGAQKCFHRSGVMVIVSRGGFWRMGYGFMIWAVDTDKLQQVAGSKDENH
jgi:hypothetical protein